MRNNCDSADASLGNVRTLKGSELPRLALQIMLDRLRIQLKNTLQVELAEHHFSYVTDLPEGFTHEPNTTSFAFRLKGGEHNETFVITFGNNKKGGIDPLNIKSIKLAS